MPTQQLRRGQWSDRKYLSHELVAGGILAIAGSIAALHGDKLGFMIGGIGIMLCLSGLRDYSAAQSRKCRAQHDTSADQEERDS